MKDSLKKSPVKPEVKREVYVSYNALAGRSEIKSVSQGMRDFIKEGFAKIRVAKG